MSCHHLSGLIIGSVQVWQWRRTVTEAFQSPNHFSHLIIFLTSSSGGAGAVVAALTDLSFNPKGYAAVFVNNFVTALFLVMIKRTTAKCGLTTTVTPLLLPKPYYLSC